MSHRRINLKENVMKLAAPWKMVPCVVAALVCCGLRMVNAQAAETVAPKTAASKTAPVKKAPIFDIPALNGITIDGRGEDWNWSSFRVHVLAPVAAEFPSFNDASATVQLGWDQ